MILVDEWLATENRLEDTKMVDRKGTCAVSRKRKRGMGCKWRYWSDFVWIEEKVKSWMDGFGKHHCSMAEGKMLGLRGLYNMGNTCFMSCILQSLMHNPMIRNYFLADCHNATICEAKRQQKTKIGEYCLACDIDNFFVLMFTPSDGKNGEDSVVPNRLLYSMWQHAHHLAGYEQQDAHEFLMSLLDGIHSYTHLNVDAGCSSPRIGDKGNSLCNCVIHQTFAGVLRSDVTCGTCHGVSTAYDPFFDLSLSMNNMPLHTNGQWTGTLNITEYLDRFMQEEHLTLAEKAKCENCKSYQDCVKQLSIHTVPNVLCIHLKVNKANHFVPLFFILIM